LNAISMLGHWGYLAIFLAAFLESSAFMGLLVPGESIVVLAGFLSANGYLELGNCIVVIALGAVLGDSVGYSLGKSIGRDWFARHDRLFLFKRKHLLKTDAYFKAHGGKTIFWGRFVGLLRAMAPFVAGMAAMPYRRFFLFNASGGILWAITFTILGYFFGQSWQLIEKWSGRAGVFVLFAFAVLAGFGNLYRLLAANREDILAWFKGIALSPAVVKFQQRHPALVVFLVNRLSPRTYLGIHLTVGFMTSAIFILIFGKITEDVLTGDPLVAIDQWVVSHILYFRSPLATRTLEFLTSLGGSVAITIGSFSLAAYLLAVRRFDRALCLVAAIAGGNCLVAVLKAAVHRPRPLSATSLIQAGGWSFPSGHAMMSVIFYGMAAYFLVKAVRAWRLQAFFMAAAAFLALAIGFSRIYLQVHYFSDVAAGFAGGIFWLTICITGLEIYGIKVTQDSGMEEPGNLSVTSSQKDCVWPPRKLPPRPGA